MNNQARTCELKCKYNVQGICHIYGECIAKDLFISELENEAYQKVGIYLRDKLHSLRKENRLIEAKELGNAYDIINKYTNNSLDLKENKEK